MNLIKIYKTLILGIVFLSLWIATPFQAKANFAELVIEKIIPLDELLEAMGEKYQVFFSYQSEVLKSVNVEFEFREGEAVEVAIKRLLVKTEFNYESYGEKFFVIYGKTKKAKKDSKRVIRKFQQIERLQKKGTFSLQQKGKVVDQQLSSIVAAVIELKEERTITGTITDTDGEPLIGATVLLKGTSTGAVTDIDGKYTINVPDEDAVLVISYIGYLTQEINVGAQNIIDLRLELDVSNLEEVVVVGYGTQKKVNLTGAVSVVDNELLEKRPVSNVQQALQGLAPNLIIAPTEAGGEPGANLGMNIRGLQSIEGNSAPYVLVDNIPMEINDVDPNDVESITILKDAASTAIYGARAAYGVILITTKQGSSGRLKVSYSTNVAISSPLNWPDLANTMDFALTMNEAGANSGRPPWLDETRLSNLAKNIANPGSAPEIYPNADGTNWDQGVWGIKSSGDYDWKSIMFKDWSPRQKHNLSISGGNERVNFYLSGGYFGEEGILRHGDEFFDRYNVDAKINAEATSWMDISLLVKYKNSEDEFPWHPNPDLARGRIFDLITKIKPTLTPKYPGTDLWNTLSRIGEWQVYRDNFKQRQVVFSPRVILEPVTGWVTNIDLNYRSNDNVRVQTANPYFWVRPNGELVQSPAQAGTVYQPSSYTNTYLSPNIYSNYSRSFGNHNFSVLAGYQHEIFNYQDILARSTYLLSAGAPSISTAVGENTISDNIGHWATQSVFGRINYNFSEKYLLEMNLRRDGSSRFESDERWGTFPSVSAGWVVSKENFFPLKNQIDFLKIRGSYGSLGNQNVDNYLYIPTLPISESFWLFNGERAWTVGAPDLTSVNLTWEKVKTIDVGFDLTSFDNRLAVTFDWFESRTTDLVGPGIALPAVLGTSVPKLNEGEITTRGWEVEISWQNRVNNDFAYGFRGVLSDSRSTVTKFNNPTNILSTFYEGQDLGEIWGYETAGLYQSAADIEAWGIDQTFIYSGTWNSGDVKYVDMNGDGAITIGDNTLGNSGDKKVIGNDSPRLMFGFSGNASWRGIDLSFLLQGIGKRDLNLSDMGTFRGPANGPFHATVYKDHMDYFRDESSALGANPDAYFPRPYQQFRGNNAKNFGNPTDRYLQNGAYVRLKNIQLGYTLPSTLTEKVHVSNARIYFSGENLLTFTDLMFFDPETAIGRYEGGSGKIGKAYPLSRSLSMGLNVNF